MHFTLEVVMPPTDDVQAVLDKYMAEYAEEIRDDDGSDTWTRNVNGFYDWYQIGGRFSGTKLTTSLGPDRIEAFVRELQDREVTVSGIVCGKQTLQPANQIVEVDALWKERFPDSGLDKCPLFDHSNSEDSVLTGDVLPLGSLPDEVLDMKVCRLAIVPREKNPDTTWFTFEYMVADELWNGATWQKTTWDGTIRTALADWKEYVEKNYREEYKEFVLPQSDWLVVTVDCHT